MCCLQTCLSQFICSLHFFSCIPLHRNFFDGFSLVSSALIVILRKSLPNPEHTDLYLCFLLRGLNGLCAVFRLCSTLSECKWQRRVLACGQEMPQHHCLKRLMFLDPLVKIG